MTVGQFIQKLQDIQLKYGDLDVYLFDHDYWEVDKLDSAM